jgi:hypothetical protein
MIFSYVAHRVAGHASACSATRPRFTHTRTTGNRRRLTTFAGVLLALTCASACGAGTSADGQAADTVRRLGKVPIPTAPAAAPTATASPGHPQLVAMGAPIQATLPDGTTALITTTGPATDPPPTGAKPGTVVTGVITVTAKPQTGTLRLTAADLASRDQTGANVTLTPVGPGQVTASPGHPATLTLSGHFHLGGAQINWRHDNHVLAIWDFTIEID